MFPVENEKEIVFIWKTREIDGSRPLFTKVTWEGRMSSCVLCNVFCNPLYKIDFNLRATVILVVCEICRINV